MRYRRHRRFRRRAFRRVRRYSVGIGGIRF